ncbi:Serine/threonine-protein kinase PknB [Posidoniimonas corsicana]|uniref:Serine/threonine-protein kinase PknB n=1 Tax=Posidoniimonas corsicana TaxID=1938618 RepID=A0A5C5VII9_9BACT|nr:serine/threonine-protein kinase [Posidoniimonas corsicana]TWT37502.1 Serine/threonine-protein kinase PknB [Posidoniimonas corsicana]
MSSVTTAEQLSQRAQDVNILTEHQAQSAWSELGTRNVDLDTFAQVLVRKGLVTNYQLERLKKGQRTGFFYGKYKVLYGVGSGTFARVYRAVDNESGDVFAVKVLRASVAAEPGQTDLFRREGELGMTLKHPNIVPIHEVYSKGGVHYMVMDFVEGRNLRELYKVRKKFAPIEAANIIADVVAGLNGAFQVGVTHRDLKMSNVLVSSDGRAMLVDFGLAALEEEVADGEAANARAIDYAGLERATGMRKDDTRSDIFFAGCMLYQMVSGRPPLSETRDRMQRLQKSRYQEIPPLGSIAPEVPAPLVMAISKAIEFDPARRYQTPAEMFADLKLAIKRAESGAEAKKQDRAVGSEGLGPDGEPRKLMIVESSIKRQDVLRELFKRNGYRVLVTGDPERALDRFRSDPATAEIVVFCTGELGQSALEMFNHFGEETATRDLPAVLLLDEAQKSWKPHAAVADHRRCLAMPIKLRELREAVVLSRTAKATAT